jgi:hypothetical protein
MQGRTPAVPSAAELVFVTSSEIAADDESLAPPGDAAADVPEDDSMQTKYQPLTLVPAAAAGHEDAEAYAVLVEACETALRTMNLSSDCASTMRRCALAARRCARLPLRELRLAPQGPAGTS